MKDLQDKWVLITGAASGIGQALAREFTAAGSKIIIADIDEAGMEVTAADLKTRGGEVICIRADMTRPRRSGDAGPPCSRRSRPGGHPGQQRGNNRCL